MSFLKGRFSSSSAKACPKPKASAKKRPASSSAQPNPVKAKVQKPDDDHKGVSMGRQQKRKVNMIQTSDDVEVEPSSQLSASDKAVISSFDEKANDLFNLDPPLGDAPFKQYLSERQVSVNQLVNEIKQKKKKSVGRRKTQKDQGEDPLFEALSAIECRLKELITVIKSSWKVFQFQFCFLESEIGY